VGSYGGKTYAVTAVNAQGLESGFSNFGWAPTLSNPASVVITPQQQRLILDPRNGYALMRQDAGSAYRQYVGSVHFHLEYTQFMALDANNHLLFSHPGDAYVDRHSVRVADLGAVPLLEFGERGSGPGQFETPAGVAAWGEACSTEGPHPVGEYAVGLPRLGNSLTCGRILVADSGNHRVQAFDSQGGFVAEFGSYGNGEGQFNNPQGLAVDPSGRVLVVDQGNNRIVALSFDGQAFGYLDSYTAGFGAPTGVAVAAWGHIVVADTGNNRVAVVDAEGNFVAEYTEPNDRYAGSFNAPRGVAIGRDGSLVIADTGNQRVVTVRGALPAWHTIWLPLVFRSD
jgi:hypothetical protein